MTVQIAVRLDDGLAEQVRSAAADAGTNVSEWVRQTLQRQAALAKGGTGKDRVTSRKRANVVYLWGWA